MAGIADIPVDLLDPDKGNLFFAWMMTIPGTIGMRRSLAKAWQDGTGRQLPPALLNAMEQEDQRRNG